MNAVARAKIMGFVWMLALILCCRFLLAAQSSSSHPRDPNSEARVKTLYAQGMGALRNRDLPGARASFEKLLRIAPGSPEAHNSLGWVLMMQGNVDEAILQFNSALQLKSNFPQAHLNLANALVQKKNFSAAELHARKA